RRRRVSVSGLCSRRSTPVRRPTGALPSVSTGSVSYWPVVTVYVTSLPSPKPSARRTSSCSPPIRWSPSSCASWGYGYAKALRKEAGMHSALIYTDAYVNYQYSDAHPLKPYRLRLTHELMQHYGLLQLPHSGVRETTLATQEELELFHTPVYL